MAELTHVGAVIRGARTFAAGAIAGATALEILRDLNARADAAACLRCSYDELGIPELGHGSIDDPIDYVLTPAGDARVGQLPDLFDGLRGRGLEDPDR